MSDYIVHNGTDTIISANETYFLRTELEFEQIEGNIHALIETEESEWVPNLYRVFQIVMKHSDTINEALHDYINWWDVDSADDAEVYARVQQAINDLKIVNNYK